MGIVGKPFAFKSPDGLMAILIYQDQIVHITQRYEPSIENTVEHVITIIDYLFDCKSKYVLKGNLKIRAAWYDTKSCSFVIHVQYTTYDSSELDYDFGMVFPTEVILDDVEPGQFFQIELAIIPVDKDFMESSPNDPYFYKLLDEHINSQK